MAASFIRTGRILRRAMRSHFGECGAARTGTPFLEIRPLGQNRHPANMVLSRTWCCNAASLSSLSSAVPDTSNHPVLTAEGDIMTEISGPSDDLLETSRAIDAAIDVNRLAIDLQKTGHVSETANEGTVHTADKVEEGADALADLVRELELVEFSKHVNLAALSGYKKAELLKNLRFLLDCGFTEKHLADFISENSSLLSIHLVRDFTPVREFFKSLDLELCVLVKALVLEPELADFFVSGALQERVNALHAVKFSRDDVKAFLKSLYRKQWGTFLRLPVEHINLAMTFLSDLGLKDDHTITLVKNCPNIILRDFVEDYDSKLKVLGLVFEDVREAKKIFVHLPDLLGRKTEALEESILYLKSMVKEGRKLKMLIKARPTVLTHSRRAMQQTCQYLQSIGFTNERAVGLLAREPLLVSCEINMLEKHVAFYKSKNLDEQAICIMMEKSTQLFYRAVEKCATSKIEFLENQGITGENLQNYVKCRPQILNRSFRNGLVQNLDFLLGLGFEKNSASMRGALKLTLPHSCKSMQSRIDYLTNLGIDRNDVCKIIREIPSILIMSDSNIKQRIDFLQKTMKRSPQELVKCPSFLNSSLERTIKPRLRVLNLLRNQGVEKELPLSVVVDMAEEAFVKKFVNPYPKVASSYKNLLR